MLTSSPPGGGAVPRLHLVTDDLVLARADFVPAAAALLEAGGAGIALHLRGPSTPGGLLLERLRALREPARAAGALLVVNDRVDVALAGGAAGVHLAARSLPPGEARRLLGPGRGVGVSVHAVEEGAAAARAGADWIFAGTVWETASHPGHAGQGPAFLADVARASGGVPVLAIGGVTPERMEGVLAAGAWGAAVIRGVWDAADPTGALLGYLLATEAWVRNLGAQP